MLILKPFFAFLLLYRVRCEHDDHPPPHRPPPQPKSVEFQSANLPSKPPQQQELSLQTTKDQPTDITGYSNYCEPENCPPLAMMVLLILTKGFPEGSFESIQSFVNDVVEACDVSEHEMRFTYTNGRENDFEWVKDEEKTFNSLQRTVTMDKFKWEKPPKSSELAQSIMHMIKALGASDNMPRNSAKYILILSDYDLRVDGEGAKLIREQLANYDIKMEVVELPSSSGSSEAGEGNAHDAKLSELALRKYEFENIDDFTRRTKEMTPCAVVRERTAPKGDDDHQDKIVAIIAAAVLLVIILIFFLTLFYMKSKLKWKTKISKFRAATYSQSTTHSQQITMKEIKNMSSKDDWHLPSEQLEILYDQKLGSGAFCCVYKGKLLGTAPVCKINPSIQSSRLYSNCDVAIKMLPPYTDDFSKSDFFQEINFMKALNYHPHLVCLLATAWDGTDPCLVTEYCANGDLLHYVREKKEEIKNAEGRPNDLRLKDLVCFAWQVSDGMDFLSSRGCIHRDLAARNVLVDQTNTAKIADFGLCRLIDSPLYSARGGRLPIKWMAIESLRNYEYSSQSDVWSFGVLLFELFSLGDVPFPEVQPADIIEHLTAGNRLKQSEFCTDEMYSIMQSCWQVSPNERPNFEILRSRLAAIIESSSVNYGYVSLSDGSDRRLLISHITDPDAV